MPLSKIRKIQGEITEHHRRMNTLVRGIQQSKPEVSNGLITLPAESFEELTSLVCLVYEKDRHIAKLKRCADRSLQEFPISDFKLSLSEMRSQVSEFTSKVFRDIKRVSSVLHKYKESCRDNFLNFLVWNDGQLRRALKPLVPQDVIEEQVKYKPLSVPLPTSRDTPQEEDSPSSDDSKEERLNKHIQLLIRTLEGVAKKLISMTKKTDKKYLALARPSELYSETPSPLAAPLPEYFNFDLASEDTRLPYIPNPLSLNETTKEKLIDKMKNPSFLDKVEKEKAKNIEDKIQPLINGTVKEADLMNLLKEEGLGVSEREELVFNLIHSSREIEINHVSLDDMLESREFSRFLDFTKTRSNFEVSKNNYSKMLKQLQDKEITERIDDDEDINSLDSSIDEKFQSHNKASNISLLQKVKSVSKLPTSESKLKSLPSLQKANRVRKNFKDLKLRSFTPGRPPKRKKK